MSQDRARPKTTFFVLLALLVLAFIVGVVFGPVNIPIADSFLIMVNEIPGVDLGGLPMNYQTIIVNLRLPRVLVAMLVGSALAISGTVMQGIFRNPLATPYILGVSAGGSAGASTVVVLGFTSNLALPLGALIGALLAVSLVYRISYSRGTTSTYTLILAGVALSSLFSAITTAMIFLAGPYEQHRVLFWMMGGLWRSSWAWFKILLPVVAVGAGIIFSWGRDLNALALGEGAAAHLGVKPETVKKILLVLATAVSAVAVSAAGTIGFVGLVIPHIMRMIVGPNHMILLPAAALGGGIFLIFTDVMAKMVMQPAEMPVGVITAFFGAPFFLYLLRRKVVGGRMR
ncbi:MAG: FecCD family ABC transporter permease [Candidatus Bipolaricaulota bacterium]